jgi:hypothetical protein
MRDGPVIDLSQVILVNKFGESLAPIMPYGFCGGGSTGDEFGKVVAGDWARLEEQSRPRSETV